jgi:endo-1,4-beta-xylanase
VPACEEVTTWGITDALTWLDSDLFPFLAKPTRPLPFDDEYRPKPAYDAMLVALAAGRPAPTPAPTPLEPTPGPGSPPVGGAPSPARPVPGEASYTG